jgi:hypothetical protein
VITGWGLSLAGNYFFDVIELIESLNRCEVIDIGVEYLIANL